MGSTSTYELLPFQFSQALKLFERLVTDRGVLSALEHGLERLKGQVTFPPLALILLIEIAEAQREIPASVTELYDRFSDITLGRYDRDKGIEVVFEYIVKKRFLSELAYHEYFERDRLEIGREEYDVFVNGYAEKYKWEVATLERFSDEMARAGIIRLDRLVSFHHRSFLDYFAALWIHDNRESLPDLEEFVTRVYFNLDWHEVAFFYVGLKREISDSLLNQIFAVQDGDPETITQKFMVGRLLQAGWYSPTKTKLEGIRNAVDEAPQLTNGLREFLADNQAKSSQIFAYFGTMVLSDISFRSMTLLNEAKSVLDSLLDSPSEHSLLKALPLLSATRVFLSNDEIRLKVNSVLGMISTSNDISPVTEASALICFHVMETDDPQIKKVINRRLRNLAKTSPATLKQLLPPKRKGFRQRKAAR